MTLRQVSLPVLRFPPVTVIPPILHTHLRLRVVLSKRTIGRSLGTSKSNALSDVEELWLEKYFPFFALEGLLSVLVFLTETSCFLLRWH